MAAHGLSAKTLAGIDQGVSQVEAIVPEVEATDGEVEERVAAVEIWGVEVEVTGSRVDETDAEVVEWVPEVEDPDAEVVKVVSERDQPPSMSVAMPGGAANGQVNAAQAGGRIQPPLTAPARRSAARHPGVWSPR